MIPCTLIIGVSIVYCVVLKQPRDSSLVFTHSMVDVGVILYRPVTLGLVPVELSASISDSHAATYIVNIYVY